MPRQRSKSGKHRREIGFYVLKSPIRKKYRRAVSIQESGSELNPVGVLLFCELLPTIKERRYFTNDPAHLLREMQKPLVMVVALSDAAAEIEERLAGLQYAR